MITVLDLRNGYESIDEAIHQLLFSVASVCGSGGGILKIIHGERGRLPSAVRHELKGLKQRSKIMCAIYGEKLDSTDETVRYVCDKFPEFCKDTDYETKNAGITFACI